MTNDTSASLPVPFYFFLPSDLLEAGTGVWRLRQPEADGAVAERDPEINSAEPNWLSTGYIHLLSQAKAPDDLLITRSIFPRQVLQELVSPTDQLQQTTPRGVVFLMGVEMRAKLVDAMRDQRNLHLGRTRILVVNFVILNDLELGSSGN